MRTVRTDITCDRCGKPAEVTVRCERIDTTHEHTADLCKAHYLMVAPLLVPATGTEQVKVEPPAAESWEAVQCEAAGVPVAVAAQNGGGEGAGKAASLAQRARYLGRKSKRQRTLNETKWAPREEAMLRLLGEDPEGTVTHKDAGVLLDMPRDVAGCTMRRLWAKGKVVKISGGPHTAWKLVVPSGVKGA